MNKVILPYLCCECGKTDSIIVSEKSWLGYKHKKSFLNNRLHHRNTLCRKCSRKYIK